MNKNILDELYDYDLFHLSEVEDADGAYRAAFERLIKAEKELKRAYPDISDILSEYQSADNDLHTISNRNEFCKDVRAESNL